MDEIRTKIADVTHKDPHSGISRQVLIEKYVHAGTRLIPKIEPDNPVDPEAVALWLERPECNERYHLGYLRRGRSAEVAPLIASGQPITVIVSEVTGGIQGKPTRGVNLLIQVGQAEKRRGILAWLNNHYIPLPRGKRLSYLVTGLGILSLSILCCCGWALIDVALRGE